MTSTQHIEVLPDVQAVARRGAAVIAEHARAAVAQRGEFTLALSGGRTPWKMFAELARFQLPWERILIYQVDERIAPAGDQARNLTQLQESLPAAALTRVRAMPVEEADIDGAAQKYGLSLPNRLDLIHLGLGPDGHTASLVPDDPVLDVDDREVAITNPYQDKRRMTITYPVIDRARALLWVVTGADKVDALRRLRARDHSIPAGRVTGSRAWLLADVAATNAGS